MTMDLREVLHDAASEVAAPPDLVARGRAAGQRRLRARNRRAVLGAGVVSVLMVTGAFVAAQTLHSPPDGTADSSESPLPASPDLSGLEPAAWRWTNDQPPDPTAMQLRVSVTWLGCHGFDDPQHTVPVVQYTPTQIQLTVWTEPLPHAASICPGTLGTPIVVPLDEPVGEREVTGGSVQPAPQRDSHGLRGWKAPNVECPTTESQVPGRQVEWITGNVREYLICPPATTGFTTSEPVRVKRTDPKAFDTVTASLSRADGIPDASTGCRPYLDGPRTILVETTDGTWSAYLPRDECGHYFPALKRLFELALAPA